MSAKLADADTGIKKAALNTFLNLILDSEANIQESQACRLVEGGREKDQVVEYALQALSMVLCKQITEQVNRTREIAEVTLSGSIGESIQYHAVTFQDEWTAETAGGTNKHVISYVRNPQYRIYLPEPSMIAIYLQAEPNVYANSAFLYIFLFKWQGEDGQEEEFEIDLKGLLASNSWGRDDGVFCSCFLPRAGYYTCTLAHDQRGRRLLYQASFVA